MGVDDARSGRLDDVFSRINEISSDVSNMRETVARMDGRLDAAIAHSANSQKHAEAIAVLESQVSDLRRAGEAATQKAQFAINIAAVLTIGIGGIIVTLVVRH